MITAGIDIGSLSAKALVMQDGVIVSWNVIPTGPDGAEAGRNALDGALLGGGLSFPDIQYIISTGYGRVNIPFAQRNVTEITCHARGAHWLCPKVRSILDIGGQDCKSIRCNERGSVVDFAMNEKCAAGTGRYLERIAAALGIPLDQIGQLSLQPIEGAVPINSYCTVFAQIDILRQLREGKHPNDILAGACDAICGRVQTLLDSTGVVDAFMVTGGVAKNIGVVKRLEERLGLKAQVPFEPQIVGALGAAVIAMETLANNKEI
jgi:predicted CoA-substrate-specific enzyme activase